MKTAVLLTTYNRKSTTLNCIESVTKNSCYNENLFDIYIADSNSEDKTLEEINNLKLNINAFNVGNNIYWSQGMNLAWKMAKKVYDYDYYFWLNDDTELNKSSFEIMFDSYKKACNNSIIIGVTSDNKNNISYGGRRSPEGELISPNGSIQEVDYINGNFVLIPKNVFNLIGFLDKKFTHSLGDIDYGLRAKKKDIKIFVSSRIIGNCSKNEIRSYDSIIKILRSENNIIKRTKRLNSPLMIPFKEFFFFNKKHFGTIKIIKFILGYLLLICFPSLYLKLKPKN